MRMRITKIDLIEALNRRKYFTITLTEQESAIGGIGSGSPMGVQVYLSMEEASALFGSSGHAPETILNTIWVVVRNPNYGVRIRAPEDIPESLFIIKPLSPIIKGWKDILENEYSSF